MDFEVAVEKLNSMPIEDIIARANELKCVHVAGNNKECIIANILADLMGVDNTQIGVGTYDAVYRFIDENGAPVMKEDSWAEHIRVLIEQFDSNPGKFVTHWAEK